MAWNLKSDKTGKVYTFADDVDQESALKYMDDVLEKPATWQEVLSQRTIEGQVKRGAVGALTGIRQIGEDLGLAEPGQAAAVRKEMRLEAEEELPKNMSITQQGVLGGLSSLPEMALTLLPGVGVATKSISTAQGLRAGLGVAGGLEGLREYGEQRDYGHGPARSAVHSGVAGAAEIIGERLPLGYVFDRFGKEGSGKFIANVLGRDVVGEEITYLIQSANEKLSRNPDMTLGEFLEGAGVTAVAAVTGGGLMGGALAGVDAGAKKIGEYRMRKSIERAFAGLNEVPTLPDAQPLRPETEGRPSADLTTQLEAFKEQNISTDLWSDVGRKYMPSFAPEQLVKTAEPTAVREALDTYLTLSPARAADFVVANLPVIAESGVDLQTFVADKVNKGELTATKANAAITAITQKVDAVTSGLRQAQLKLAETSDLEEADFTTAEDQKFREAVGGSEIRLWADAYSALHGDARLGREHLSQADFTAAGIPQAQAEYLETLDASGQRTIVSENRGLLSTLLGDTSRSAPRTAATVVGDFPFYKQFVEPQTAVHKDWIGRRVTFGPAKGAVVQNTTILDFKSGEVNVVPGIYDANAPSDLSTVERRMAAITRQWVKKYAPGMSVVLRVSSNANSRYGGHHYMGGADGGKTVHFIDVNVGQKSGDLAEIIQTLSHEFGHALFTRQFYLATPEMRETLRKQWVKEMFVDKFDQTAADIVKGNRPGGYVGALDSPMRRLLTRQLTRSVNSPTSSVNTSLDYWTNFMEWHAHMMERMLVADYRDMQAPVRRYWKEAFARIKKFFAAEHTKWAPEQTIDQWLKLMARREEAVQTEMQRYDFMDAALKTNAPFMSPDYMEPKEVAQGNDAQIIPDNMRMESPTPITIDSKYTLQIFKTLQPREKYSKQQLLDLARQSHVTKSERELVIKILDRFDGKVIRHDDLIGALSKELENIKLGAEITDSFADYGLGAIRAYVGVRTREPATMDAVTKLYTLPFEVDRTGMTDHFGMKNLFGHVREFVRDSIIHVVEIQSDLVQALTRKPKELSESSRTFFTKYLAQLEALKVDSMGMLTALNEGDFAPAAAWFYRFANTVPENDSAENVIAEIAEILTGAFPGYSTLDSPSAVQSYLEMHSATVPIYVNATTYVMEHLPYVNARIAEVRGRLGLTQQQVPESLKSIVPHWWKRLVRETLYDARQRGKEVVRFATPDTVAQVEGWARDIYGAKAGTFTVSQPDESEIYGYTAATYNATFIKPTGKVVISNDENGKPSFIQAEFARFNGSGRESGIPVMLDVEIRSGTSALDDVFRQMQQELLAKGIAKYGEFYNPEHTGIYNRYRDIEKFLLSRGGQRVVDNNGVSWIEVPTADQQIVEVFSEVAPAMRDFPEAIDYVKRAFKKADPTNGPQVTESLVKFNRTWAFLLGSFQVLGLNKDVPGATRFLNALRAKFGYKSEWLRSSNITANRWEGLGKERAGTLAKLLMTEAETDTWFSERMDDPKRPGHYIFVLDEAKAKEFKVDDEMAEVYSEVRDNYMRALDAMETLGRERLVRQFADDPSNPQMDAQLRELEASYANMRDKPYTPFSRFGQFYAKIRAKENGIFRDPITGHPKFYTAGQTVYFETFETAADRDAAMPALRKKYGSDPMLEAQFNTGKIHDIVYSVRNLPPQFIRSIADRLGLTAEQLQEYNEIVKDLAADTSFVKHMKRKANISGYSPDALRGFADYFLRFANNYAKGKSAPELEAAMADVRQYKRELEQRVEDTTKLDEFYNWLQRTHDYVMNPGNEFAEFKSFVTAWYLGFNIPTAAQNITQLPFWTLPYLSKRFGMAKSMATIKTALNDVLQGWKNLDRLTADEKAMMTHALEQGFIDESFATSVAQFAEGTALTRLTATATRHRVLNWYNHKSLWMFQKAEEINRRTSLLAAYRLNRKEEFAGAYDADAFLAARETVEVTQNEYALENRPEFMRGKASVIFQFLHYVQNAIFRMTPWGDDSWKRLLLMQLAVAGLMGLPFAEDLLNAAKFLARRFGIHFEPELEMRQLLMELNVAPDWVLRGAAAHLGPFDLSFRYSLGKVIPGMEALASNQRFTEALANGVGDVGGAGASVIINAMRAMYELEHNPDKLKAMQYTTPTFVKYGMQAMSAAEEGGVIARNGALIAPLDQGEILGMSIGLQPKSKMHAYEKVGYEVEARNYWMARRATLLEAIYHARRTGDREALADTMKHLREYNAEARRVDRSLVVTAQTLQRSVANRGKVAAQQEVWGSPYKNPELTRGIQSGYSE